MGAAAAVLPSKQEQDWKVVKETIRPKITTRRAGIGTFTELQGSEVVYEITDADMAEYKKRLAQAKRNFARVYEKQLFS